MLKKNDLIFKTVFSVLVSAAAVGCQKNTPASETEDLSRRVTISTINETPAFQTGFQGSTAIVYQNANKDNITGEEALPSSNWVTSLEGYKYFSEALINYESSYTGGGNPSADVQRKAEIIADPTPGAVSGSKVLRFKITQPHILSNPNKARIQLELDNYNKPGKATEYRQVVRMYLGGDFKVLTDSTSNFPSGTDWLNLFEYWNDAWWDAGTNKARIGVSLYRTGSKDSLRFRLTNENMKNNPRTDIWAPNTNTNFVVPIAKWMTVTIYIKEGDVNNGRFVLKCKLDGQSEVVVFDKTGETKFPGVAGNGMTSWNVLKLYCSDGVINRFKNKGKPMIIYYDNLKLYTN